MWAFNTDAGLCDGGGMTASYVASAALLNGVSEIMAPNNFDSALSKAALKGPLKGPKAL